MSELLKLVEGVTFKHLFDDPVWAVYEHPTSPGVWMERDRRNNRIVICYTPTRKVIEARERKL